MEVGFFRGFANGYPVEHHPLIAFKYPRISPYGCWEGLKSNDLRRGVEAARHQGKLPPICADVDDGTERGQTAKQGVVLDRGSDAVAQCLPEPAVPDRRQ